MTRRLPLAVFFAIFSPALFAEPNPVAAPDRVGDDILGRYLDQVRSQAVQLRDVDMNVEIDAEIPRLNRKGKLSALRSIGKLGQITYNAITFQGDDSIKRDVIARYMQAEIEGSTKASLGINLENYKFKYAGTHGSGDWKLHLFEVQPRKKLPGLFEGWVWIEDRTGLPVREQGVFAKSPSVFLRKISFVRDYRIVDGQARPISIDSTIETRIVGKAEIKIALSNYHSNSTAQQTAHARR